MFKLPFFKSKKEEKAQLKPKGVNFKLILGLGNPGSKYEHTYHNAGHLFIDFATKGAFKKYRNFAFAKEDSLIFAKALTYMNQSGLAAREALKYFNLEPKDLLLVHDDSDLPLGEYKITSNQGSAGHNGVQSVIEHLGTQEFGRLRIGVRGKQIGKAGEFILRPMSNKELQILQKGFSTIRLG